MISKQHLLHGCIASVILAAPHALLAQTTPPSDTPAAVSTAPAAPTATQVGEILVTAQRRPERLQDVPIAVTAVSGAQLAQTGITDITDIKIAAPGATVRASGGVSTPYIRGVGSSAKGPLVEPPIALYVDGVYMASPTTILTFNNVDNVEVLKGPQGTLFGRNATGGLIQVTTKDPTQQFSGSVHAGYGNYNTVSGDAYVSGGITKNLAMDFAVTAAHQGDGYGYDYATGKDVYKNDRNIALRSKALWTPGPDTRITLIGDYSTYKNSLSGVNVFVAGTNLSPGVAAPVLPGRYDSNDNIQPIVALKGGGVSLKISQDFGSFTVNSISAYRRSRWVNSLDLDALPTDVQSLFSIQRDSQITQELQIQSKGQEKFTWQAGVFYFHGYSIYDPTQIGFGDGNALADLTTVATLHVDSVATYGQATYKILPNTNLTFGARFTYERRDIDGQLTTALASGAQIPGVPVSASSDIKRPTFRVALDHKLSQDVMVYASFNTGIKSGGYNSGVLSDPPFKPEKLTAYEAGIKSELFDRRVRFNLSGFYYDYADIQVQVLKATGTSIQNGDARIYGVDGDMEIKISPQVSLTGGIEWLHAKYTKFDQASTGTIEGGDGVTSQSAAGNDLPYAPHVSANAGLNHVMPLGAGKLHSSIVGYYASRQYAQPDNITSQKPYAQLNGSVEWEADSGFSIRGWVSNLTNVRVMQNATNSAPTGRRLINYEAPRLYGVTLGYKF